MYSTFKHKNKIKGSKIPKAYPFSGEIKLNLGASICSLLNAINLLLQKPFQMPLNGICILPLK